MTTGPSLPEPQPSPRLSILLLQGLAAAIVTGAIRWLYYRFVFDVYDVHSPFQRVAYVLQNALGFLGIHIILFDWIMDDHLSSFAAPVPGKRLHSSVYRDLVLSALPWLVVPWAWSRLSPWRRTRLQGSPRAPNSSAAPKHR